MKTMLILAAATAAFVATPAMAAGEARVEARGGIAFANGNEEAIAGIAAGYDFDLGDTAFAGVEVSGDKLLVSDTNVILGTTGRIGAKLGTATKLYAEGGYSFGEGEDAPHIGVGVEQKFGTSLYGKLGYRLFLNEGTNINAVVVGLGAKF